MKTLLPILVLFVAYCSAADPILDISPEEGKKFMEQAVKKAGYKGSLTGPELLDFIEGNTKAYYIAVKFNGEENINYKFSSMVLYSKQNLKPKNC